MGRQAWRKRKKKNVIGVLYNYCFVTRVFKAIVTLDSPVDTHIHTALGFYCAIIAKSRLNERRSCILVVIPAAPENENVCAACSLSMCVETRERAESRHRQQQIKTMTTKRVHFQDDTDKYHLPRKGMDSVRRAKDQGALGKWLELQPRGRISFGVPFQTSSCHKAGCRIRSAKSS
jgi:hypothetical protein